MVKKHVKGGGSAVLKTFQSPQITNLVEEMKNSFSSVRIVKPAASRKKSSEIYIVAKGFRCVGFPS